MWMVIQMERDPAADLEPWKVDYMALQIAMLDWILVAKMVVSKI